MVDPGLRSESRDDHHRATARTHLGLLAISCCRSPGCSRKDAVTNRRRRAIEKSHALLLSFLIASGTAHQACAAETMTCAQAISLVASHPGIEANSIISAVVNQWEAMDRRTAAGGHAPITQQMMTTPSAIDALSGQCIANPGQSLGAAAAQVYRVAREQLDGF